jgi:hypothetical protein
MLEKKLNIQSLNTIKDAVFNIKTKECDVFVAESVSMRYGQRANQYQVPSCGMCAFSRYRKNLSYRISQTRCGRNCLNG